MAAERKTLNTVICANMLRNFILYAFRVWSDTLMLSSVKSPGCRSSGNSKYIYRCFYYHVRRNIVGYDSCYVTKYRSRKTGDSVSGKTTWTYIQCIDRVS